MSTLMGVDKRPRTTENANVSEPVDRSNGFLSVSRIRRSSCYETIKTGFQFNESEPNEKTFLESDESENSENNDFYQSGSIQEKNLSGTSPQSNLKTLKTRVLLKDYICLREKTEMERIDEYTDKYPVLELRKAILRIRAWISGLAYSLVKSKVFEGFIILTILLNTVVLAIEDPKATTLPYPYPDLEWFFLIVYTSECLLKILAFGLIFPTKSYFKDPWNFLDCLIVITAWLNVYANQDYNLNALRVLRILRPLRSITSIKGLRALVMSLLDSVKPLLAAIVILIFSLMIFAICGLQLWMGLFRYRCVNIYTGVYDENSDVCGTVTCGDDFCIEVLDNPYYGTMSFDNIYMSFIAVFQIITLEGWYTIMTNTQRTFSYFSFIYFIPLVYLGSYLLLNLTKAIIAISFTNAVKTTVTESPENVSIHTSMVDESEEEQEIPSSFSQENGQNQIRPSESLSKSKDFDEFTSLIVPNKKEILRINYDTVPESKNIEFSSPIAKTISWRATDHYQKEILNQAQKKIGVKKRLATLKNEIKINKSLARKLKTKAIKEKDIIFRVYERLRLRSSSIQDFISSSELDEVLNENFQFTYQEFPFCSNVVSEHQSRVNKCISKYRIYTSKYSVFVFLSLQTSRKEAYQKTSILASRVLKEVAREDLSNFSIQAEFSAYDIDCKDLAKIKVHVYNLSYMEYRLWGPSLIGLQQKIRKPLLDLVKTKYFAGFMSLCVLINVSALCYDHYGISQEDSSNLDNINIVFSFLFLCEMILKILGFGFIEYSRDTINYLDAGIVVISMVEYFLNLGTSAFNAFRVIRILRIFRVIRVMRVFRYMSSMALLISVISKSIVNLLYLILLLTLFCIIFTLLGMQLFGGRFDFIDGKPRENFDSFHYSFLSIFQLLSTENWNDILASAVRSAVGPGSALFLIVWIILGNFILLNLVLAILLDSFDEKKDETFLENNIDDKYLNPKNKKKIEFIEKIEELSENDEIDEVINLDRLLTHKLTKLKNGFIDENECEKSYYFFTKSNSFRSFCIKLTKSQQFESAILLIITLNTMQLIWDTYTISLPSDSSQRRASYALNIFFSMLFAAEFVLKSVSLGLVLDKGSYFRDSWNRLDFIIVVVSILDFSVTSINLPIVKIFRLLRTLRPLKLISHNVNMKIVVTALIESVFTMANIMVVILLIWLVFAILGVSFFAGKMYHCTDLSITTRSTCEKMGMEWVNSDSNFDNVFEAMLVLFIISSQESWPNRMYEGIDAAGVDVAPITDYNPYAAYFYVVYVLIGNMFLVNLFAAVVFNKFNEAKQSEMSVASLVLNRDQLIWIEIQSIIVNSKPKIEVFNPPTSPIQVFVHKIVTSVYFESAILFVIILNTLVMSLNYYEATASFNLALDNINISCTYIFITEAFLKITGLGFKGYIHVNWNKFDFFVVLASISYLIMSEFLGSGVSLLRIAPQLIRIIRVMRVSRIFKLFTFLKPLQNLIVIISYALPNIINVLSLLLLIFMIFSILGVFLFSGVTSGKLIDEYTNFYDFHHALLTLWRVSTGEDYPSLMHDCVNSLGSKAYVLYFITFIGLTTFIMLDLFISVVIENYEEYQKNPNNVLLQFNKDVNDFKIAWKKHAEDFDGGRVTYSKLPKLMIDFGPDLGVPQNSSYDTIIRTLSVLDMNIDEEGFTYYNDMLYGIMKRKYAKKMINVKGQFHKNRILLRNEEVKTKMKISQIRLKYRQRYKKIIAPSTNGNLFITWMYARMAFKSLKKWKDVKRRKSYMSSRQDSLESEVLVLA